MVAAFMMIGFMAGGASEHSVGIRVFAFAITVLLPGAGGVNLLRQHLRERGAPALPGAGRGDRQNPDSEVLRLAERLGGRVTVVEVVAETGIGADAAEETLGGLVARGMAEPEVTDGGLVVYRFPDIEQLKDKGSSHGVLEE